MVMTIIYHYHAGVLTKRTSQDTVTDFFKR